MSNYSPAPLVNETTAAIPAHAFRALLGDIDGVFLFHLFSALGFDKLFNQTLSELNTDSEKNSFFLNAVREADSFRNGYGLYLTPDIVKTLGAPSTVIKISVTGEDGANGGVVAYVIPNDDSMNSVLITSGGVSDPAYSQGVGTSVLGTDFAFTGSAETIYTISGIVAGEFDEAEGTNWASGKAVAVAIYSSNGGTVTRKSQVILRHGEEGFEVSRADADETGHIPLSAWTNVEVSDVASDFSFAAHSEVSDALNKALGNTMILGVVGADERPVASKYTPLRLSGPVAPTNLDAFGYDQHPVSTQQESSYEEVGGQEAEASQAEVEPFEESIVDDPFIETTQADEAEDYAAATTYVEPVGEEQSVLYAEQEIAPDQTYVGQPVFDDGATAEEIANQAEYEVTHGSEGVMADESTDPSAETADPFILGAEYLEQEVEEAVALEDVVLDVPQSEPVSSVSAEDFAHLDWGQLESHEDESTPSVEGEQVEDPLAKFSDLSWDDLAVAVADDDTPQKGAPNSFLTRPSE